MKPSIPWLIALILLITPLLAGCTSSTPAALAVPSVSPSTNHLMVSPALTETESSAPAEMMQPSETPTETVNTPTASLTARLTPSQVVQLLNPVPQLLHCVRDGCVYTSHQVFQRPIPPQYNQKIDKTYPFGSTQYGKREVHYGVEFVNPTGTPVTAVEDGIVEFAGNDLTVSQGGPPGFYGNLIVLRHEIPGWEEPVFTVYAHLSRINVQSGETIRSGQVIGEVGATGTASGSHLHFEVRQGRNAIEAAVNPAFWLVPLNAGSEEISNGSLVVKLLHRQGTVYTVEVIIQSFISETNPQQETQYAESYAFGSHPYPLWKENLMVGDLASGLYRIAFNRLDRSYQKYVEIEPGQITLVEFEIDY